VVFVGSVVGQSGDSVTVEDLQLELEGKETLV